MDTLLGASHSVVPSTSGPVVCSLPVSGPRLPHFTAKEQLTLEDAHSPNSTQELLSSPEQDQAQVSSPHVEALWMLVSAQCSLEGSSVMQG